MKKKITEESYEMMIQKLFHRFPSYQKVGAGAYKPGIASMEFADQLMGHPHRKYKVVHVAGTNGKGSVSNMIASVLASMGLKVGLYTSPHILDFRERIRLVRDDGHEYISKDDVWSFVSEWNETFDHLDMSFFEITTMMAFDWFAAKRVDVVVLETGLGGRLDSTNIVTPVLSVITNIGLDHCDMLGWTLPEIAYEKAGIIKPGVPVVVGESHPETDSVFERKVLYTNLSLPRFMGDKGAIMSLLTFADKKEPMLWGCNEEILEEMDLKGTYQRKNLRTALAALEVLLPVLEVKSEISDSAGFDASYDDIIKAIINTSSRTGFRGRWEKLSENPCVICDIGHNEHGLKYNFTQLEKMISSGEHDRLIIIYGSVADKDLDSVIHLLPSEAVYIFTQAHGKRALPSHIIRERYSAFCMETGRDEGEVYVEESVECAVHKAFALAEEYLSEGNISRPLIYIGGSTYVVAEAIACINDENL